MALLLEHRRFTADEYMKMAEVGILGEDDRVELLNGEILPMSPIGDAHVSCVDRLTHLLVHHLGDRGVVRVQSTLRLSDRSMPEPDLCVLKPSEDFYAGGSGPGDVLLIIEVCDSSLIFDRRVKLPLYAEAGIPEVWLIDLAGAETQVYRHPGGTSRDGYAESPVYARDAAFGPVAFDSLRVDTNQLIGR
jgi:Uma2 family endonuclease